MSKQNETISSLQDVLGNVNILSPIITTLALKTFSFKMKNSFNDAKLMLNFCRAAIFKNNEYLIGEFKVAEFLTPGESFNRRYNLVIIKTGKI